MRKVGYIEIEMTGETMEQYICTNCGYVYDPSGGDPENGIPPGTDFDDLPSDWVCPVCYVSKEQFDLLN